MKIRISKVRPVPIFEKHEVPNSEIWNQNILFEKGQSYHIKAPSGGGKSTLLHCIYGLRKDYEGKVVVKDKDIKTYTPQEMSALRRNNISIVFQDLKLLPNISAKESIELTSTLHTQKYDYNKMAAHLDVKSCLEKETAKLSYGQRQRIALIRALARPFDFLLLDEPFSHLDPKNTQKCCSLIQERIQAENAGLILVNHVEDYNLDFHETFTL